MVALAIAGMGAALPMLVAGVAMTVEVAAPRGPRITVPVGLALLAAGLLALA